MKLTRSTYWIAAYAVAMVAGTVTAQAQVAAPTPAPVAAPAEVAAPVPEETPAPVPETMAAPEPGGVTVMETMAEKEQAADEDHEMAESGLSISMFADSYYNFDWNLPPQTALGANGSLGHTAYVNSQGFGLAFVGLDASYSLGNVSATTSLRFGSGTQGLIGQYQGGVDPTTGALIGKVGLQNIWQAYVSWAPTEKLAIDLGQFATVYGAEVGESWLNLNYTRGALYFNFQPFWHTGARMTYQATDEFAVKLLLDNGVNTGLAADTRNSSKASRAPDVGVQLVYTGDGLAAYLGYYGNPIKPEGRSWSHFGDLVLVGTFGDATVIFNADVGVNHQLDKGKVFYGVSLAGGYQLSDQFGVALRGEYLGAPQDLGPMGSGFAGFGKHLITGTLTLDYKPADGLVIRLDNRLEAAELEIFATKDNASKTYFSSVLGVVVHTN
jgi:hypothetical protein